MPFPTPQTAVTTPPVAEDKSLDHFKQEAQNLDELLLELNTPKQNFTPTEPEKNDFDSGFQSVFENSDPETPPITPEQAAKSGKHAAKMLDTGISFALKMFAQDDSATDYRASQEELDQLADPLSDLSEKYNFKISPEIVLIFLIVTIYLPKYFIASERRQVALEKRQDELEKRMKKIETID